MRKLLLFPALFLLAPLLPAQEGVELPPRRDRGPRGDLELPKPVAVQEPTPGEDEAAAEAISSISPFWGEPAGKAESVFVRYEAIEKPTRDQERKFLADLRKLGLGCRGTALRALASPHAPSVILAAHLLEWVGDPDDALMLIETASGVGVMEAVTACLETSLRLNGGWLPSRAVRLLDHPTRAVRSVVEARLARKIQSDHRVPLLQLLVYGRQADTRLRSARLLREFVAMDEVRDALLGALSDSSVPVAFQAAEALAGKGTLEDIAWLEEKVLSSTEDEGARSYLLFGLVRHQESLETRRTGPDLLNQVRASLESPNLFLSGCSAVLLAESWFRSSEPGDALMDRRLAFALVRAVGGLQFYPQYSRFSPFAESTLCRITGTEFPDADRSAWLHWYEENKNGFRMVRGQLGVGPEELDRVEISWSGPDHVVRSLVGGRIEKEDPGIRWMGRVAATSAVALLDSTGVLEALILPGEYGIAHDPVQSSLLIQVGERRKSMVFRGGAGRDWVPGLLKGLDELWSSQAWQILAGGDHDWILDRLSTWDARSEEERAGMMLNWSRDRLDHLDDSALLAWCRVLKDSPAVDALWNESSSLDFLDQLRRRTPESELARTLMNTALTLPDPSLTGPVVAAVEGLGEPLRSEILVSSLGRLGVRACETCLNDDRLVVRAAAARALGQAGPPGREALLRALDDQDQVVVCTAVRSLGKVGDASVLPRLLPLASPGNPREVRRAALDSLGFIGIPSALPVLAAAARESDPSIRLAASGALCRMPGEDSLLELASLFPSFAGTQLEEPFCRALSSSGAGLARTVLLPHLEAPRLGLAHRAAVQAGRLADPASAPFLIGSLGQNPRNEETLAALAACLSVDFTSMPDPAGVYTAWWRDHAGDPAGQWLIKAAKDAGFFLPEGFAQSPDPVAGVTALLEILEKGPGILRPSSAFWLNKLTGEDAPAVTSTTPAALVSRAARDWKAWLEGRLAVEATEPGP